MNIPNKVDLGLRLLSTAAGMVFTWEKPWQLGFVIFALVFSLIILPGTDVFITFGEDERKDK